MCSKLLILLPLLANCQVLRVDLGGSWTVQNANTSIKVPATVPGNSHTDLFAAGIIDEPYNRFGDTIYRWVAYEDWTYSREFILPNEVTSQNRIDLVCEGLDTVGHVMVNGIHVGESINQHIGYRFDVTDVVQAGVNTITVHFESTALYGQRKNNESPVIVPHLYYPNEISHRNFVRHTQSDFAWDWGPAFLPVGIYRDIRIEAYTVTIDTVMVFATPLNEELTAWSLTAEAFIESSVTIPTCLNLSFRDQTICEEVILVSGTNRETVQMNVVADAWWPNNYGEPNLYDVQVEVLSDAYNFQYGFRTVELIQEPVCDEYTSDACEDGTYDGTTFYFRVNGLPIFIKGANMIPVDSFQSRVTVERLENLLQSAKDGNQNMVRIWGGGIYPQKEFYELTDQLGLMVWEEFMFACSLYPADPEFLRTVAEEAEYQVKRLQRHPSLMIWSGNNENEVSISGRWYGDVPGDLDYERSKAEYLQLYFDTIYPIVSQLDPSRPWVESSPSGGLNSPPGNPDWDLGNSWDYGDLHHFVYTEDCWDTSRYPIPRFLSEFGVQSYPAFMEIEHVSLPQDWEWNSPWMCDRQKRGGGCLLANQNLMENIERHYLVPENADAVQELKYLLWMTQLTQADCIRIQTEHYRRYRSMLDDRGLGNTMGTMYWQSNDIWEGASWSSLEFSGRWKMLHYYTKNIFEMFHVSADERDGELHIIGSNDLLEDIVIDFTVTLYPWDYTWTDPQPFQLRQEILQLRESSFHWLQISVDDLLSRAGPERDRTNTVVVIEGQTTISSGETLHTDHIFYVGDLSSVTTMKDPTLSITDIQQTAPGVFSFAVQSAALSPYVWLETHYLGRFSDNGFLQRTELVSLQFYSWEAEQISAEQLKEDLIVWSLYDTNPGGYSGVSA